MRRITFLPVVVAVLLLLHGIPALLLFLTPGWPVGVRRVGGLALLVALVLFPLAMVRGHGRRRSDRWAVVGDSWLGIVWQLFVYSVLGFLLRAVLAAFGVAHTSQPVAVGVLVVVGLLCAWGTVEARRVPRVRRREVVLDRLPDEFDGFRLVLIADTHFGPIDRSRWSRRLAERVNGLEADLLAHAGDIADGTVPARLAQAAPLADMRAVDRRVYITGNHEYSSGAAEWTAHVAELGWTVLRNGHTLIRRGDQVLAVAGIDDRTAAGSGVPGHGADLVAALAGIPAGVPVVLLCHQPKLVGLAVAAGVDLQLSGHTHGGQIWPFHLLVRAEQRALHGLSQPGPRTQLYVTRGSGFWGPPFRVFAPSEISVLTLRGPRSAPVTREERRRSPGGP